MRPWAAGWRYRGIRSVGELTEVFASVNCPLQPCRWTFPKSHHFVTVTPRGRRDFPMVRGLTPLDFVSPHVPRKGFILAMRYACTKHKNVHVQEGNDAQEFQLAPRTRPNDLTVRYPEESDKSRNLRASSKLNPGGVGHLYLRHFVFV